MPKLWENPHYTFARSVIAEVFKESRPPTTDAIPEEYIQEFAPSTVPGPVTPGIARGPKNVVVVVGESVSAQYLSLYGSPLRTWPTMEAEAAHSLVFRNYYSQIENTSDALFTISLSRYAPITWRQATIEHSRAAGTTVAEVLKPMGYRTAFISGGDNSYAKQDQFLANRGFDLLQDRRDVPIKTDFSWGLDDSMMFDLLLKFIDEDRTKPFYICSWTQGTHHPFRIPPGVEAVDFVKGDKALGDIPVELNRYLNALAELDRQLGRFFNALRERGLAEDTIVIITGDHGQAFGAPHNGHYHSGNLYQEDVRVPFVVWSPGLFKKAEISDAVGGHVDLAPSVLDLVGVSPPAGWQGRSLLAPTSAQARTYFFGMRNDYLFGVRESAYKYILNTTQDRDELYDISADPQELTNIAVAHPELRRRLRQRIGAWLEADKRFRIRNESAQVSAK
jgi:arylsulfatase A-like enzyme